MKKIFTVITVIVLIIGCEQIETVSETETILNSEDSVWKIYDAPFCVSDLSVDKYNNIYAITENGELYKFSDSIFVKVFSLNNSCFKSINFDKNDNILIGTSNQGVLFLNKYFRKLGFGANQTPYLSNPMPVWKIFTYDLDTFLITDFYYTYKYCNYKFEIYDSCQIWDLKIDNQNNRLIGYPNELIVENGIIRRSYQPIPNENSIQNRVYSIATSSKKSMILTYKGLFEYKDGILFESRLFNEQFKQAVKLKIEYCIKNDNFWIGTSTGLIEYYNDTNYSVYNSKNTVELKSDFFNKMITDKKGNIWIYDSNRILEKIN